MIVTVHCTSSVASIWLAPRIADFHAQHPDVQIHLRTAEFPADQIVERGTDLSIVRLPANTEPEEKMRKLWDARIFPVCSPEYLARHGPFASPDQLCGQDLIHTLGYNNDWHRWARKFASPRTQVKAGFSVDGLVISIEAACRSEGIILGRSPLIDPFIQNGRLVEALPGNPGLKSSYLLTTGSRAPNKRSTKLFVEWIVRQAKAHSKQS